VLRSMNAFMPVSPCRLRPDMQGGRAHNDASADNDKSGDT
jgi:hypothetical protein